MSPEDIEATGRILLALNDPQALGALAHSLLLLAPTEKNLRANEVPAMCLVGGLDPFHADVERLRGVLTNTRIEVLEDGDHMTTMMVPWFREHVRTFLAAHSAESDVEHENENKAAEPIGR
jgi:hypothetical protein